MHGLCHRKWWKLRGLHPVRREEQLCCTPCFIKQIKYMYVVLVSVRLVIQCGTGFKAPTDEMKINILVETSKQLLQNNNNNDMQKKTPEIEFNFLARVRV